MLKIELGLSYPTQTVYTIGTKYDDLIDQLEFSILELEAPITKYIPEELEDDEFEQLIPLNGGEYYIDSAFRDGIQNITFRELIEELPLDDPLTLKFIDKWENKELDDVDEEEVLREFYEILNEA